MSLRSVVNVRNLARNTQFLNVGLVIGYFRFTITCNENSQ
jgi:hypothetical protein